MPRVVSAGHDRNANLIRRVQMRPHASTSERNRSGKERNCIQVQLGGAARLAKHAEEMASEAKPGHVGHRGCSRFGEDSAGLALRLFQNGEQRFDIGAGGSELHLGCE